MHSQLDTINIKRKQSQRQPIEINDFIDSKTVE